MTTAQSGTNGRPVCAAISDALFEQAPTPFVLVQANSPFTIVAVNQAYVLATGFARDQIVGQEWLECFPGDLSLREVSLTLKPDRTSQGAGWIAVNTPLFGGGGELEYILHSLEPAAADRIQSERDAFLVRLDDATGPLAHPREIVRTAARMLGSYLRADRCAYCAFNADQETFLIESESLQADVPELAGRFKLAHFGEAVTASFRENLPYVESDLESDGIPEDVRAAYRQVSARAVAVTPLHKAGRLVAALGVHQRTPRKWLSHEVDLVSMVANRCWEAIQRADVARALQENEERLRLCQRTARVGSYEWLIREDRVFLTPELEVLFNLPEGTFEGRREDWRRRVVAEDAERVRQVMRESMSRMEAEASYEYRAILPDGQHRWLRGHALFFYDETGTPERVVGVNVDIDSQKRAEADLRESETRLRAIFDGTYECIGLLATDGTVLEANRACLKMSGAGLEGVAGKFFWELPWFSRTPGGSDIAREGVMRAAAGEFVRFEATLLGPSEEFLTFDISLHPIVGDDGEVALIVPEGRDISDRKRAEESLKQQWTTFDTALSNTPDITYTFDLEGRFTYANRQLVKVSRRSLKDTVGRTPRQLGYPAELAARIERQIEEVIETRRSVRAETAFTLPGGEVRDYEYIYEPVISESGEVTAIAGASRDITERRRVEQRLRESEARFRQLFDSMPQLAWSSTPDGRDDLYNQQWFDYTGLSYERAAGDGWKIIHPDDLPAALERWKHSLETGEPYEVEYRCRRHDGSYHWFLGRAQPVCDTQGRVVRWFGTCTDIDGQKESEAALRKANRELEEFSYVASHDLQEPLRMVNIYIQLILKRIKLDDDDLKQYADYVQKGVSRMDALIRGLLTFSRTAHSEDICVGEADLAESFSEAMAVLRTEIEDSGAIITAGPLPAGVRGDTAQMAHVFQNLLSNALKYRSKNSPPRIRVRAEQDGGSWVVRLEDNGIGFDPKYSERIFGLFKRLHKDDYPGTGLGLAICQRIVERYGGRMWADGRPGEGATFFFTLPSGNSA